MPLKDRVDIIFRFYGNESQISRSREEVTASLPSLLTKCNSYYKKCSNNMAYFTKKYQDWLKISYISGFLIQDESCSSLLQDESCVKELLMSPKSSQFLKLSSRQQIRKRK